MGRISKPIRGGKKTWKNDILVGATGVLALFFLTRLVNTILQWKFLLQIYPPFVPVYLLISGVVFSFTLLPLGYGFWRRLPWTRRAGRLVILCWSVSTLAEGAYAYSLGWRNGWEMNLILWLGLSGLMIGLLQTSADTQGYGDEKEGKTDGIHSRC